MGGESKTNVSTLKTFCFTSLKQTFSSINQKMERYNLTTRAEGAGRVGLQPTVPLMLQRSSTPRKDWLLYRKWLRPQKNSDKSPALSLSPAHATNNGMEVEEVTDAGAIFPKPIRPSTWLVKTVVRWKAWAESSDMSAYTARAPHTGFTLHKSYLQQVGPHWKLSSFPEVTVSTMRIGMIQSPRLEHHHYL